MACRRPYDRGVCAVGVIAVGVAPRIDKVVGGCVGVDHCGFGFEVPFAGRGRRQSRRSDKIAEESCSTGWSSNCGRASGPDGVGIVICIVAVAGGLEGGNFGLGGGGGTVTANGPCGTEGKACEDADNGDNGEELDQGERAKGTIFILVERRKSGCSHRYDFNFISQISKGKKQLVHVGGVAGGDLDHRASGRLGLAGDQRGDEGGKEGGGGGDGGIDQNGGECILCGVFFLPIEQWHYGFNIFDQHEHDEYEWRKLTGDCFFGGATKVYQLQRNRHSSGIV